MGQQQGKTEIKIHREIITKLRWLPIRGSAFNIAVKTVSKRKPKRNIFVTSERVKN